MTNTEYLLRTVRESEHMSGWNDAFEKMRENITKEFSSKETELQIESYEAGDTIKM